MANATFTDAWVEYSAKVLFRGATPPDPNKFRVCLGSSTTLGRSSSISSFITSELIPTNGYSRATANFSGDGAYDVNDRRYENTISVAFTASGGALQFQSVFLIADGLNFSSRSFTNSEVSPTTDIITINNHGFSNGDRVTFTADALATLPGGIAAGNIYTVSNTALNTFKINADISDTGSGTFRARAANGIVVAYATESAPITVPNGQGYSYQFPLAVMNTGYVAGV